MFGLLEALYRGVCHFIHKLITELGETPVWVVFQGVGFEENVGIQGEGQVKILDFLVVHIGENAHEQLFKVAVAGNAAFFVEQGFGELGENLDVGVLRVAFQLSERRFLDLSHTFTSNAKMFANFLESVAFFSFKSKTVTNDVLLFVGKYNQQILNQLVQLDLLSGELTVERKISVNHFDSC